MFQIVLVALICAIIIVFLKSVNSELANLTLIMSGIILFFMLLDYINEAFEFFNNVVSLTGLESGIYKIVFKVTAIGYLFEFASGTVEDFGLKSLSTKLIFAGKIIILTTSLPILYAIINLLSGILK